MDCLDFTVTEIVYYPQGMAMIRDGLVIYFENKQLQISEDDSDLVHLDGLHLFLWNGHTKSAPCYIRFSYSRRTLHLLNEFDSKIILNAPDGHYNCSYNGKWSINGNRPLYDILNELEAAKRRISQGLKPILVPPDKYRGPM